MSHMHVMPAHVLDQLEGAVIVSWRIEEDTGLHFTLQDGRELVIAGFYYLSLVKHGMERLH